MDKEVLTKEAGEQMKLSSISSGSKGNCILVENEDTALLVDVGVSKRKWKKDFPVLKEVRNRLTEY